MRTGKKERRLIQKFIFFNLFPTLIYKAMLHTEAYTKDRKAL